ncbi:LacI family DNA-binding transcriptional regulator [Actibacterium pelagium]|uniref:Alanine racemase n=1 Tax=Actibacterium pelagium TaxID=2029103 RepID=A0A917ANB1_9RHOB|nr:LacI family DNA-binding transcriptional regulator [Actibacterium pelagium]GGE61763.1 alanine racemase [Actibacterium pelagium]
MTTQRHIAKLAKTSLKTVSRVINKDPLVNEKTRKRVEKIIADVGYQPSQAARMVRSQTSNIVGFVADRVATTPSSIDLIRGAQDEAWDRGKHMMLFNIEEGKDSATLAAQQLSAFRAEAIIHAAVFHQKVSVAAGDIPYVLLNCFEEETRFPTVVPDDARLAYDLTERVLSAGYCRPLFLNLASNIVASGLRARGFVEAGEVRGIDLFDRVVEAAVPDAEGISYLTDQILPAAMKSDNPPDVIVCGQDLMAIGVYSILQGLGLKIGQDVAVVSFDNLMPLAELMVPGLTTVELPYYDMGRAAMALAIDGQEEPRIHRLHGRIAERQSL